MFVQYIDHVVTPKRGDITVGQVTAPVCPVCSPWQTCPACDGGVSVVLTIVPQTSCACGGTGHLGWAAAACDCCDGNHVLCSCVSQVHIPG